MSQRRHAALLVALVAALVTALTVCLVRVVIPRGSAAAVSRTPPAGAPITRHLALVVVDGLRYDLATDATLMPEFARRMREETSGEIWASPVSMTSSAVLTYGTGQRGDLDQIVNNESGSRVGYDHLALSARAAGLTTACAGDHAWFQLYGGSWDLWHPDPEGVAIDVAYDGEIFDAARAFLAHDPRPNLLVVHFVTPDHQAHAYGVTSERYRSYLRGFDRALADLLGSFPDDTTVFVTSDHGATDTGTHGSDTPIQRRSPIFAFGRGIVRGRHEVERLDQIDVPDTFAALLGIAAPAHGRGHVLVDWLDASDSERAAIACADVARLATYARAAVGAERVAETGADTACAEPEPRARIAAARAAADALDERIEESSSAGSPFGWVVPCIALLGAIAIASVALLRERVRPRAVVAGAALGTGVVALGVAVVFAIERLPGRAPTATHVAMTIAAHVGVIVFIVRGKDVARWLDARAAFGAAIVPGLLLATYTRTTQFQSFVLAVVIGALATTVGLPHPDRAPYARRMRVRPGVLATTAVLVAMLAPIAAFSDGYLPQALVKSERLLLATALAAIALFGAQRHVAAGRDAPHPATTTGAIAIAGASLVLRRIAPASVCEAAWLGLGALAIASVRRAPRPLVELAALGSYAWVSRDAEIPILLATYVVATVVGAAAAADLAGDEHAPTTHHGVRPSAVLLLVTFAFGWTYVQRIGIQLGVDFDHLDWGAGAFREPGASLFRIGAALAYKHALARAAILFAVLVPLGAHYRVWVARGVLIAELARVAALVTMLYVSRDSFWTAMRALGDLPHALLATMIAAAAYAALAVRHASDVTRASQSLVRFAPPDRIPPSIVGRRE